MAKKSQSKPKKATPSPKYAPSPKSKSKKVKAVVNVPDAVAEEVVDEVDAQAQLQIEAEKWAEKIRLEQKQREDDARAKMEAEIAERKLNEHNRLQAKLMEAKSELAKLEKKAKKDKTNKHDVEIHNLRLRLEVIREATFNLSEQHGITITHDQKEAFKKRL